MKNKLPALTLNVLLVAGGVLAYRSYQAKHEVPADSRPGDDCSSVPRRHDACQAHRRRPALAPSPRRSSNAAPASPPGCGTRSRSTAANYPVSAATGSKAAATTCTCGSSCKFFNEDTALLQISNGRFLWSDQRLPAGRSISRLDLRKVRSEWSRAEEEFDELEPGTANWSLVRTGAIHSLRRLAHAALVAVGQLHVLAAAVDALDSGAAARGPAGIISCVRRRRPLEAGDARALFAAGQGRHCAARTIAAGSSRADWPDRFVSVPDRVSQAAQSGWTDRSTASADHSSSAVNRWYCSSFRQSRSTARLPLANSIFRRAKPSGTIAPPNTWKPCGSAAKLRWPPAIKRSGTLRDWTSGRVGRLLRDPPIRHLV